MTLRTLKSEPNTHSPACFHEVVRFPRRPRKQGKIAIYSSCTLEIIQTQSVESYGPGTEFYYLESWLGQSKLSASHRKRDGSGAETEKVREWTSEKKH